MKDKLRKIFSTFNNIEKLKFRNLIVLGIFGSILETISILMIFPTLEIIFNFNSLSNVKYLNFLTQSFTHTSIITIYFILIIFLFLSKGFILIFIQKKNLNFFKEFEYRITSNLFSKYLYSTYKEFINFNFAKKIRNINEVGFLINILMAIIAIIIDSFFFLFVVSAMLIFNFKISFLVICSALLFSYLLILSTKKSISNMAYQRREKTEGFYASILDSLNSLKEIIILNRQKYFIKEFKNNKNKLLEFNVYLHLIRIVPKILVEIFLVFILLILIFYFYLKGAELKEVFLILSFYTISGVKLIPSLNKFIVSYQMIRDGLLPAGYVADEVIKYSDNNIEQSKKNIYLQKKKLIFNNSINFSNVSFKFDDSQNYVLENINFNIAKSDVIGIVGKSGSGKSTLVNILMGLYSPTKGKVFVDNFELKDDHKINWFSRIGYVPQDIYLINDTIKNNITLGIDEDQVDVKKLDLVIEQSNLNEFLDKKELNLSVNVGEKAIKISGGQSQRVVIARALYHNPEILILDEATSRLDEKNEYQILSNLTKKLKNLKTIVIISHRPESLKKFCNKIYEIKDKQIKLI